MEEFRERMNMQLEDYLVSEQKRDNLKLVMKDMQKKMKKL